MKFTKTLFAALFLLGFTACTTEVKDEVEVVPEKKNVMPTLESLTRVVDSMQAVLDADIPKVVIANYEYAIGRNIDVYTLYPKSDEAAKSLDLAQGYAAQIDDYRLSVKYAEILLQNFDSYPGKEKILFDLGNNYNLMLRDTVKAKVTFEKFINEFPNSPFIEDAKFSLGHLGRSPEDIVSGMYN